MPNKKKYVPDDIAIALGLKLLPMKRYRLNPDNLDKLEQLRGQSKFERVLGDSGFEDPSNWKDGWLKTKEVSIRIRNPHGDALQIGFDKMREMLRNDLAEFTPTWGDVVKFDLKNENLAMVLDIADLHIGKKASANETGEEYNTGIAVAKAKAGVAKSLRMFHNEKIQTICFVIGNDVLHVDNAHGTTTSGTGQDVSGMWFDNFTAARDLYVHCITELTQIAPVHVIHCPSNHDYVLGFALADTIQSYFHKHPNVTFDVSIAHRKYFKFGKNLLGFSHGDGAKMEAMPLLMAQEAKTDWSQTDYRHIYLHHIHHSDRTKFQSTKEFQGVTVEFLRSLSGADSWHHRNGYQHAKQAVEIALHEKSGGVAHRTSLFL